MQLAALLTLLGALTVGTLGACLLLGVMFLAFRKLRPMAPYLLFIYPCGLGAAAVSYFLILRPTEALLPAQGLDITGVLSLTVACAIILGTTLIGMAAGIKIARKVSADFTR